MLFCKSSSFQRVEPNNWSEVVVHWILNSIVLPCVHLESKGETLLMDPNLLELCRVLHLSKPCMISYILGALVSCINWALELSYMWIKWNPIFKEIELPCILAVHNHIRIKSCRMLEYRVWLRVTFVMWFSSSCKRAWFLEENCVKIPNKCGSQVETPRRKRKVYEE